MSAHELPVSHRANGLQDFIAISRSACNVREKRRREKWIEAIARVRNADLHELGG